jgi:hypothetical protein
MLGPDSKLASAGRELAVDWPYAIIEACSIECCGERSPSGAVCACDGGGPLAGLLRAAGL